MSSDLNEQTIPQGLENLQDSLFTRISELVRLKHLFDHHHTQAMFFAEKMKAVLGIADDPTRRDAIAEPFNLTAPRSLGRPPKKEKVDLLFEPNQKKIARKSTKTYNDADLIPPAKEMSEMVASVLASQKKPMRPKEIAEILRAENARGSKNRFFTKRLNQALLTNKKFKKHSTGIYDLDPAAK